MKRRGFLQMLFAALVWTRLGKELTAATPEAAAEAGIVPIGRCTCIWQELEETPGDDEARILWRVGEPCPACERFYRELALAS